MSRQQLRGLPKILCPDMITDGLNWLLWGFNVNCSAPPAWHVLAIQCWSCNCLYKNCLWHSPHLDKTAMWCKQQSFSSVLVFFKRVQCSQPTACCWAWHWRPVPLFLLQLCLINKVWRASLAAVRPFHSYENLLNPKVSTLCPGMIWSDPQTIKQNWNPKKKKIIWRKLEGLTSPLSL